jgi:uncharacterized protein (DUF58 family)
MRLPHLTGRGAIALGLVPISTVAGLLLGAEELVLLGIAAATLLVVGLVQCTSRLARARGKWRIEVQLTTADVPCGLPSTFTLTLSTSGGAGSVPVRLTEPTSGWEDVTGGSVASLPAAPKAPNPALTVPIPAVVDDGTVTLRFPNPTERRGVFRWRGASLWCFDGLALFSGLVGVGPSATITVLPTPADVDLSAHLLGGRGEDEQIELLTPRAPRRQHNLGDFAGLRTYVPGDRLRLLYWPALARSGELLVRDFDDTSSRRLHLLADVRSHLGVRGAESVLATTASAGLAALAAGTIVEFSTTAGDSVAVGPGPQGDLALLRAIAAVALVRPREPRRRRAHSPHVTAVSSESFARADLVITTPGGANSLPAALRHGHLVIAP